MWCFSYGKDPSTKPWLDLDWDTGFLVKMQQTALDATLLFCLWCPRSRCLTLKTVSSFYISSFYSPCRALKCNSFGSKRCWRNIPWTPYWYADRTKPILSIDPQKFSWFLDQEERDNPILVRKELYPCGLLLLRQRSPWRDKWMPVHMRV